MNAFISITLLLWLAACGRNHKVTVLAEQQCNHEQLESGILVNCKDGSSYYVNHGEDGVDGANGVNAYLERIELCPSIPGAFKESIFRDNEGFWALYYSKKEAFLTELSPGSYVTTDGRDCSFEITEDMEVVHE